MAIVVVLVALDVNVFGLLVLEWGDIVADGAAVDKCDDFVDLAADGERAAENTFFSSEVLEDVGLEEGHITVLIGSDIRDSSSRRVLVWISDTILVHFLEGVELCADSLALHTLVITSLSVLIDSDLVGS